ncbi:MAG TPA: hypothetical protein VLC08_03560 [Chitinolyticbacter sp.]|nr:hypothetical protein [Chitinolyticbacter sp.]
MASSSKKRKDSTKPLPSVGAFHERELVRNDIYTAPKSDFPPIQPAVGGDGLSSYPHLTHKTDKRAEHLTDVRLLGTVNAHGTTFNIHERFHRDNTPGSKPIHDRFLATTPTGVVHTATSSLDPAQHQPKGAKTPSRGDEVFDKTRLKTHLTFNVSSSADTHHPPLSPRTQRRTLDGNG